MLVSRLVTFKNAETPEHFLQTAREKLAELEVVGEPQLPIHLDGERAGVPAASGGAHQGRCDRGLCR